MPNRILKETIKSSPQIDCLSWFEEVVFYRLMVTADDYGCMDGRIVLLKNELFPTKDNVTKKAIEDAIARLVSIGLLCKYTVNGMPYLFFPTWEKHQRIRNKHRKYPDPTFDSNSLSNDGQMIANCQSESESESESNKNPNQNPNANANTRAREKIPPDFDEVVAYCAERGGKVDPQRWFDYYTSNGWRVGKSPMKDWKAAVRTWERNGIDRPAKKSMAETARGETDPEKIKRDMERMRKMKAAWEGKK